MIHTDVFKSMKVYYINLTNGIEAIPIIPTDQYRFIRIQSTLCEQKNWNRIIQDLDYDFLMNVALGNEVVIYDFGAGKPIPKAIYQGVEFIKYVLYKRWLNKEYMTSVNRTRSEPIRRDCNSYFESCYKNLDRRSKTKLDYFKPYVVGVIRVETVTGVTRHDNDKGFYREILMDKLGYRQ